jgi:hypothetical protein
MQHAAFFKDSEKEAFSNQQLWATTAFSFAFLLQTQICFKGARPTSPL